MNILRQIKNLAWCKPEWSYPSLSKEAKESLRQCIKLPHTELLGDIEDIIKRSNSFPIPFPIQTVRLEKLKEKRPVHKLARNIISTYPVMHERVLILMTHFLNYKRCKPEWSYPSLSKEAKESLRQCIKLPHTELLGDIEDIIKRSNSFPIPFPIQTVRLEKLKEKKPVHKLAQNIISTYPLMHERVLILMTHFLNYKREFGSEIEKAMYKDMTLPQFVDRILKKRAVTFMSSYDEYLLLTGAKGKDGWEAVGTSDERPPLLLEKCLSYDEMKLSAMVFVSGYTECINNGNRYNKGIVQEDNVQDGTVIIGVIGARLERDERMEFEDIVITRRQNREKNGYGTTANRSGQRQWRHMWAHFYQVSNYTYEELVSSVDIQHKNKDFTERYVKVAPEVIFDNEVYYKRLSILAETTLLEAQARGRDAGRDVYLNVIGAGLGVWKMSSHQTDVYVLTFVERIHALLERGLLTHVADVNFAFIRPTARVLELFENSTESVGTSNIKHTFLPCDKHPKGGINVQLENREPTAKLVGVHAGKLLVITYPWDGNAHPGNEFWMGSLSGSGDPAAACSTQVSELHNAHVNPAVSGLNVRVAGRTGLSTLPDCCLALTA